MQKKWLCSTMAVSAVTLSLLAACSGDNGKDGTDGADGANGTSCTVESLKDSSGYKILCGGDSVGVLTNGSDGDNGANGRYGNGCYVEDLEDGSGYDIYCGNNKVGQLLNGTNGESCTVKSTDDGAKITCGGVSTVIKSGTSCTATSVDGGYELTCGGKTIGTILNGANGENGTSCVAEEASSGSGYELYCDGQYVGKIENGESCTITDNQDGTITQTCGEDEVTLYKALCGDVSFDPTKYACANGTLLKFCIAVDEETNETIKTAYDTTQYYCRIDGSTEELGFCDGEAFNTELEYCSEKNKIEKKEKCGEGYYNPEIEYCSSEKTIEALAVCETEVPNYATDDISIVRVSYNPEGFYCGKDDDNYLAVLPLPSCGKTLYNPNESYCNDAKKVVLFEACGNETFKPDYEYCDANEVKDLDTCGTEESFKLYNPTKQYCSQDKAVKELLRCGAEGAAGKLYNPELTICDIRDYNLYNYTTIGDQVWTASDMKYSGQSGNIGTTHTQYSSARYYNWSEAMGLASTYQTTLWNDNDEGEGIQGVCPNGWHIPSLTEVNALRAYLGETYEGCENGEGECGQALKALDWDEGTDEYGFSATNTGYGYSGTWNTQWSQNGFYMWTSKQTNDNAVENQATRFSILNGETTFTQTTAVKTNRFPVRCIKD